VEEHFFVGKLLKKVSPRPFKTFQTNGWNNPIRNRFHGGFFFVVQYKQKPRAEFVYFTN
jgi:hypothetical protein